MQSACDDDNNSMSMQPQTDATEAEENTSMKPASSNSASAAASADNSAYRQIERQYKLPTIPTHLKKKHESQAKFKAKLGLMNVGNEQAEEEWMRWKEFTIDPRHLERNTEEMRKRIKVHESPVQTASSASSTWISPSSRLLSFTDIPGFHILTSALDPTAQAYWSWRCVYGYANAEHTNLTNLERLKKEEAEKKASEERGAAGIVVGEMKQQECESEGGMSMMMMQVESASENDGGMMMQQCDSASLASAPTTTASSAFSHNLPPPNLSSLRWSSLGYQYNWTSREYTSSARDTTGFPSDLSQLTKQLAHACGGMQMEPEAAIVNYYPASGSMGAHIDDAELTKLRPIVSLSLGCSAIFLLGGRTKSSVPTGFLLRSGDVVVMGGESRVCFHGVPRIVDASFDGIDEAAATSAAAASSQLQTQVGTAAMTQAATAEWTPERVYNSLRFRPSSDSSASSSSSTSEPILDLPSDLLSPLCFLPSRSSLLHTFSFLRHSRLNINVRQVEDQHFKYSEGMTSKEARRMKLEEQQAREEEGKGEGKR